MDHLRSLQNDVKTFDTGEPKEFWRNLKRLGSKPKSDIGLPMEVYNDAGEIESDLDTILYWINGEMVNTRYLVPE